jgi:hypothetical protein
MSQQAIILTLLWSAVGALGAGILIAEIADLFRKGR